MAPSAANSESFLQIKEISIHLHASYIPYTNPMSGVTKNNTFGKQNKCLSWKFLHVILVVLLTLLGDMTVTLFKYLILTFTHVYSVFGYPP